MPLDYLHRHEDFNDLIRTVAEEKGISPDLVEKDYWIMHCLYGLTQQGYSFELKGGTSLSKGFQIIHRFSEDIDIRIEPHTGSTVATGKNQNKAQHCESRKAFYDQLAQDIVIDGIDEVVRDHAFDDEKFRSAGIRLKYSSANPISAGVKDGVLLEVGFDTVTPNRRIDISSWALDFAKQHNLSVIDNLATAIPCYEPGYTFVEKLQTIATKYRNQQERGSMPRNFMRHYYDVYCLLEDESVKSFIGTDAYHAHKRARFPEKDYQIPIAENEAFILSDVATRKLYQENYLATSALYYREQPNFDALLERIRSVLDDL
ncbi:nucleotidyl transferase AbiEii/AbiGii toxin family protein [Cellvibrio fontiphilus]|uniref:Nucleotidyl transferase AbiEii/AbiGii toxin family protein n=1 Tax=Cellvibrio fontiphilus TaxID=1815559 RepID=A0ABV7FC85_9GAMM